MQRYKIATLKARATSNTAELIVNVYEWDDDAGSVAYFDVKRAGTDPLSCSDGVFFARFDELSKALAFAAQEIGGRLEGSY